MKEDPRLTFSAGRLMAKDRATYLRAILHGLTLHDAPEGTKTIAVTEHGQLLVNWDFIATLTVEECAGVLVHECMHVLLDHCGRTIKHSLDLKRSNMAQDLAINPAVLDMGFTLPGGGPGETLNDPRHALYPQDFGWDRGLMSEEYYDKLRDHVPPAMAVMMGLGEDGQGEGEQKVGGGFCGSCTGRPVPNEPPGTHEAGARSEADLHRIRKQVARDVKEAKESKRTRGTVPDFLDRWADDMIKPAVVPWYRELGVLVRSAVNWRPGAGANRYDAPSRRQAGIGYGPGKPIMPRFRTPVPHVAVILDTSGSMSPDDLGNGIGELGGILKATGADVTFVTCDAQVHGVNKVATAREALKLMRGGGGTDMGPAIAAVMKMRPRPEVLICLTDLEIGDPGPEPHGAKMIWVAVGATHAPDPPWGKCIRMQPRLGNHEV